VALNFIEKLYFDLSFFSIYRLSVALVVKNSILIPKFIFLIVQFFFFFFVRGEREEAGFRYKKRKLSLTMILSTKKVKNGVNGFHFIRAVSPRCFFFFSLLEEANLNRIYVFGFGLISFFTLFFEFYKAIDMFWQGFRVFSICFGSKRIEK